ncbi:hypothetical protein SeLEV6574_g03844 [Synchytrium endobioticum]|nr:hypothetical protein SeLEV6574_g03842 [Synchytrium endobioticum]TPX45504.1 hypothetical protein SeLEV6574_g03844 [Synchytrium endobioticum]
MAPTPEYDANTLLGTTATSGSSTHVGTGRPATAASTGGLGGSTMGATSAHDSVTPPYTAAGYTAGPGTAGAGGLAGASAMAPGASTAGIAGMHGTTTSGMTRAGTSGMTGTTTSGMAGEMSEGEQHKPSSMHAMKEKLAGTFEQGIGKMTGNTDRVVEGEARKQLGNAESELAKHSK